MTTYHYYNILQSTILFSNVRLPLQDYYAIFHHFTYQTSHSIMYMYYYYYCNLPGRRSKSDSYTDSSLLIGGNLRNSPYENVTVSRNYYELL